MMREDAPPEAADAADEVCDKLSESGGLGTGAESRGAGSTRGGGPRARPVVLVRRRPRAVWLIGNCTDKTVDVVVVFTAA